MSKEWKIKLTIIAIALLIPVGLLTYLALTKETEADKLLATARKAGSNGDWTKADYYYYSVVHTDQYKNDKKIKVEAENARAMYNQQAFGSASSSTSISNTSTPSSKQNVQEKAQESSKSDNMQKNGDGTTGVSKQNPKQSDASELDGLTFTDLKVEASTESKSYFVYFTINNKGDRIQNVHQSDFVIKKEGENTRKPYKDQRAFKDEDLGKWWNNEKQLYPGDSVKTLLLFYVDTIPSEYTLYYVKSDKLIPVQRFK